MAFLGKRLISGIDCSGSSINDIDQVWADKDQYYGKAGSYWESVDNTVEGVMGGFGALSAADLGGSAAFYKKTLATYQSRYAAEPSVSRQAGADAHITLAADCGAGVGRVTKGFLSKVCHHVHLVEPDKGFLDQAEVSLASTPDAATRFKYFQVGLQNFEPQAASYDLIWIQWVIGHLPDDDFVAFLERCKVGLRPGGIIVVKENISRKGFVFDTEDSSVTRCEEQFMAVFEAAHLQVFHSAFQTGWPKELFRVKMFALAAAPSRE